MKLDFINHASVIVAAADRRILCDLWLEGRAFDDGWALLSKSAHSYRDLAGVTDLWFSHEHPDHFNPPNLKQLPPEARAKMRVLYQRTIDHRVIDFCRKLGFGQVEEIPPEGFWPASPGVELLCRPHAAGWGEGDSWLALRSEGLTILNVNDCEIDTVEQARAIAAAVGPVDVLFSQFSYASWQGNEEAVTGRRRHAAQLLERLKMRIEVLKPKFVVPFASFIRFCHEENAYLNRDANQIGDVTRMIERETAAKPIVLYPGDRWTVGEPHDNASALSRYQADLRATPAPVTSPSVEESALCDQARAFCAGLVEGADPRIIRLYLGLKTLQNGRVQPFERATQSAQAIAGLFGAPLAPAFIHINDYGRSFAFELDGGLVPVERARTDCDVELSSSALSYCFRFPWGGETLQVNGRFREPGLEDDRLRWTRVNRLFNYFRLARRKSFGYQPNARALAGGLRRRVWVRLEKVVPGLVAR